MDPKPRERSEPVAGVSLFRPWPDGVRHDVPPPTTALQRTRKGSRTSICAWHSARREGVTRIASAPDRHGGSITISVSSPPASIGDV